LNQSGLGLNLSFDYSTHQCEHEIQVSDPGMALLPWRSSKIHLNF